jgi:hypothetical protein
MRALGVPVTYEEDTCESVISFGQETGCRCCEKKEF